MEHTRGNIELIRLTQTAQALSTECLIKFSDAIEIIKTQQLINISKEVEEIKSYMINYM